jgi:malonyl-CoA/methylmalonyl-CoA synthetase
MSRPGARARDKAGGSEQHSLPRIVTKNHLYDALLGAGGLENRPFLKLPDGAIWTYGEMRALAARLARVLGDLGCKAGDRIAVQVEKSPESLALYLACVRAGLVFVPLNPAYTLREVAHVVGDAQPAVFVCEPDRRGALGSVADECRASLVALTGDHRDALMQLARAAAPDLPPVACAPDDLAAILYTSGTTGRPKGAMISHANLLSNARTLVQAWRFTRDDVLLHALPIFHTHGLFVACNVTLLAGGSLLLLASFDVDEVIRHLPNATAMMGVPTYYVRLLARSDFSAEATRNIRLFISGSAPLLPATHVQFLQRTGHRILERYGMTETSMITTNPYHGERRAGTVGMALDGVELRLADPEHGGEMGLGEIGVIELRGPNVFSGYWNMPEKTAQAFRDDGYFITGDMGLVDADGYLKIVGRASDMIISGGLNIYPKEVEAGIDQIDGVLESAVFGVPHPDFGEAVCAVVVLKNGVKLVEADIVAALRGVLAAFKQPKRVIFSCELPRNAMSKVQKGRLRADYAGLFDAS